MCSASIFKKSSWGKWADRLVGKSSITSSLHLRSFEELETLPAGYHQSGKQWNGFWCNIGVTSERCSGAHMDFSKCICAVLNWTNCVGGRLTFLDETGFQKASAFKVERRCLFIYKLGEACPDPAPPFSFATKMHFVYPHACVAAYEWKTMMSTTPALREVPRTTMAWLTPSRKLSQSRRPSWSTAGSRNIRSALVYCQVCIL